MTHGYLGLVAFDLTTLAVGYAALYGLGLIRTRRLALRGVALAFFTGWALLGVCLTTALVCGLHFDLLSVLVTEVLLIGVSLGVRRFFPTLARDPLPEGRNPLLLALAALGAGVIVVALVVAFVSGLHADADASYDLYAFWLLKAKAIYFFHDVSTAPSGTGTYVHPSYPLLMPTLTATSFEFMGGARTLLLPLQQSILPMAFFGSIATLVSSHVPRWLTYPSLAMLIVAPGFSYRIIFVLPDLNLAFLFVLAAVAAILWIEEQRAGWLVLATLFLTAGVLTKAEAEGWAIMLIVALVAASAAVHGRRGLRTSLAEVAPPLDRADRLQLAQPPEAALPRRQLLEVPLRARGARPLGLRRQQLAADPGVPRRDPRARCRHEAGALGCRRRLADRDLLLDRRRLLDRHAERAGLRRRVGDPHHRGAADRRRSARAAATRPRARAPR